MTFAVINIKVFLLLLSEVILCCVVSGYDGFGEVMRPSPSQPLAGSPAGLVNQSNAQSDKLIQSDLDGSLALLAGNLSIRPDGQMKKFAIRSSLRLSFLYCMSTTFHEE